VVTLGFPGDYIAPQGKDKASRNTYKGGTRARLQELARLLREQCEALKRIGVQALDGH
jgi:hypothetical protein